MRVEVLGGGPAGLYAALLLKKGHPGWQVTVHERNPRDATYGWGVVFSDRTLAALHEADVRSWTQITEAFVHWDAIDMYVHDELLRCGGHAFAGIGRRRLLNILQARCEELGVALRFEDEVADPERLRGECDLLIAADGVNSRSRAAWETAFTPEVTLGRARYVWYGADRTFDAFTFIFRDTQHGLFQVHAYPYDATRSTFIVECHEETWRRAGLDRMSETESLAFCQALFADHLTGRTLLSNRSLWIAFPTLTCRRWVHENVVLLGDAAHTAHFSIGSGTKLALEDAIALAAAFEQPAGIAAALRQYELNRRPRVEGTQRAAAESRRYFETVGRYRHLAPEQFSFHLLTRSGRISWDNLRERDPRYVARVERWFQAQATPEQPAPLVAPPPLFTPLGLRSLRLRNRIVMATQPRWDAAEGCPSAALADEAERLAAGGAGLVLAGPVAVAPAGRVTPGDTGLWCAAQAEAWRAVAERVHRQGAALALVLSHAGRRGATQPRLRGTDQPLAEGGWELLAPSAIAWGPRQATPRAMDDGDLARVRAQFAVATAQAAEAGVDLLLLQLGHGYLLHTFLSPLANLRDDAWGGDAERRLRFPLAVAEAVRAAWPEHRPLGAIVPSSDRQRGGLRQRDAIALARTLGARGVDLVAGVAGQLSAASTADYQPERLARETDVLRNEARLPALALHRLTTSGELNTLLAAGRADLGLLAAG